MLHENDATTSTYQMQHFGTSFAAAPCFWRRIQQFHLRMITVISLAIIDDVEDALFMLCH